MKKPYTFKIDPGILEFLKGQAPQFNRSFNNHIETILRDHVQKTIPISKRKVL